MGVCEMHGYLLIVRRLIVDLCVISGVAYKKGEKQ